MPKGNKSTKCFFNDNKTILSKCGAAFRGTYRATQIRHKLHIKKCPICIKNGAVPYPTNEVEKVNEKFVRINSYDNRFVNFTKDIDKIREHYNKIIKDNM